MTTDTPSPFSSGMQAETGFELDESTPPLRVTGFICLVFGLLSIFSLLGKPLLLLPLLALIFGVIALRRSQGLTPAGTRPAMLGLVLAVGFGACGFFLPWMKTRTLGKQAEQFSRDYMELVARGHDELAVELQKDYVNRFPTSMSLAEHYAINERARETLSSLHRDSSSVALRTLGPDANWVLERPVRIYYSYGKEHAEVIWMDPSGKSKVKLQFFMDYTVDSNGDGQWHVDVAQAYRERLVAESVL